LSTKVFFVEADGVDHQLVAIVMAHGFAGPGRLGVRRMCHVHIDMPHLLVMLVDHQDFLGRLDEDRNVEGRF